MYKVDVPILASEVYAITSVSQLQNLAEQRHGERSLFHWVFQVVSYLWLFVHVLSFYNNQK